MISMIVGLLMAQLMDISWIFLFEGSLEVKLPTIWTFTSEKAKNTSRLDHFWKFRLYRKSARCCGAKHISKSKCTKHTMYGPLLEVEMSKKCTQLWHEAHFEVKMLKALRVRTTFGS